MLNKPSAPAVIAEIWALLAFVPSNIQVNGSPVNPTACRKVVKDGDRLFYPLLSSPSGLCIIISVEVMRQSVKRMIDSKDTVWMEYSYSWSFACACSAFVLLFVFGIVLLLIALPRFPQNPWETCMDAEPEHWCSPHPQEEPGSVLIKFVFFQMSGSPHTMCTPLTKSLMNQGMFNYNYCFVSFLPLLLLRRESAQSSTVGEGHCSLPPPPAGGCFAIGDASHQYNLGKVSVRDSSCHGAEGFRRARGIAGAGEQLQEG